MSQAAHDGARDALYRKIALKAAGDLTADELRILTQAFANVTYGYDGGVHDHNYERRGKPAAGFR